MKRRRFLKVLLAFLGAVTFASFFYTLLRYLAAIPAQTKQQGRLVISKKDIPLNESRNFVLDSAPIVVINTSDKGIVVLSRVCTHLGCLVEYNRAKQKLLCPCHAGTFNIDGSTAGGPPPKPLTAIPYRIDGDNIILG